MRRALSRNAMQRNSAHDTHGSRALFPGSGVCVGLCGLATYSCLSAHSTPGIVITWGSSARSKLEGASRCAVRQQCTCWH